MSRRKKKLTQKLRNAKMVRFTDAERRAVDAACCGEFSPWARRVLLKAAGHKA